MSGISRFIRSATLYGYADLASSLGLEPAVLLRQVGLTASMLADPDSRIPIEAANALLELSAQAGKAEDFGLRLAARRRLANLGPISVVLREEPTALAALRTLERYRHLVNPALGMRVEVSTDLVVVSEDILTHGHAPLRQPVEMAVGVLLRVLQELLGADWRPRQVCFMHRPPRSLGGHRTLLGQLPVFDAEFNGLVCGRDALDAQLPGRDAALARFASLPLDRALADAQVPMRDQVAELMPALLPFRRCTADTVAKHLGVDRRTVHRRLQAQGDSFSGLLQTVRVQHAKRLLAESGHPVEEVAELLGFADSSAFGHWFRHSLGTTASQWRRDNLPAGPANT